MWDLGSLTRIEPASLHGRQILTAGPPEKAQLCRLYSQSRNRLLLEIQSRSWQCRNWPPEELCGPFLSSTAAVQRLYGAKEGKIFHLLWAAKWRQRPSLWGPPDKGSLYPGDFPPVSFPVCQQRPFGHSYSTSPGKCRTDLGDHQLIYSLQLIMIVEVLRIVRCRFFL